MTKPFAASRAAVLSELPLPGLVYRSAPMRQLAEDAHKLSASNLTLLLTGESGTGKELVARAIHTLSPRRERPFVAYNCAAIPRELLESELFGHKKGSFTGAIADTTGVIRAADGGTLLLDEIGDLPLELQPKLLRFLQEGEVHTVGEPWPRKVDVRLIAATNRPLEALVEQKLFRPDLYYRLQIVGLHLPPLRERVEDLPLLIEHFLKLYGRMENKPGLRLAQKAREALLTYEWPGNVRELSSEIYRAVALAEVGRPIQITELSAKFQPPPPSLLTTLTALERTTSEFHFAEGQSLRAIKEQFEQEWMLEAMKRHQWNGTAAAEEMGLSRQTLRQKMRAYPLLRKKKATTRRRKR